MLGESTCKGAVCLAVVEVGKRGGDSCSLQCKVRGSTHIQKAGPEGGGVQEMDVQGCSERSRLEGKVHEVG